MPDWADRVIPQDAGQLWTAVGALATVLAIWFAYWAARHAGRALRIEQTAIVNLVRQGDRAELRNVGPGLALNVLLTDDDGDVLESTSALRPGESSTVVRLGGDPHGFYVYAQSLSGRWHCTRVVYQGLAWRDGSDLANTFRGRISAWRLPRQVRQQMQRRRETSWDYFKAISSPWTIRGWALRLRGWRDWGLIEVPRGVWRRLDRRRVRRFRDRLTRGAQDITKRQPRESWLVNAGGYFKCWRGPRLVKQLDCNQEDDYLVCDLEVLPSVHVATTGLLCIHRTALSALPKDPEKRDTVLNRKLRRYLCRLRPEGPFVFELRKVGPFLLNWP